jgi:RNA polymerase sigma-70 factor (ECF subfamily)
MSEQTASVNPLESFEEVALPHMNDLYRAAHSMMRHRQDAEDVLQEMYLRAWRAFDRFEPGTNCRAWLFKILFNVIRNHRRKWFRLVLTSEPETFEETLVYEAPVAQDLTDDDILGAFQKLPPQFSEVVMLVDVYDFSYKEAHETLNVPIGTVMSRLSRGRQLLREHLVDSDAAAAFQRCETASV